MRGILYNMVTFENGDSRNPKYHAIAGGMTGFTEYSIMYPMDFIKTRMQVLKPHPEATYKGIVSGIVSIMKEEGPLRFFRGMTVPLLTSIPAHTSYYVIYEKMKRLLSGTEGGYDNPVAQGTAGAMAIMSHNIIMNPADVIKQRMQMYDSAYKSSFQCFQQVRQKEGFRAFYRSLPTQMAIDAPYGALHFVIYEFCQNITNPSRNFDATSHIVSGAVAGGIAAASTTPLDVCRTLINTQEVASVRGLPKYFARGLTAAASVVYKTHGIRGFFRGLTPRVLHHVPSVAICWLIYEFFKRYFLKRDHTLSKNKSNY